MPRYSVELEFQGAPFCGWQRQSEVAEAAHLPSLQSVVEGAIARISRQVNLRVQGCGRTDAGVHALRYVLHFDLQEELADVEKFRHGLNAVLPGAVVALKADRVDDNFHALDNVVSKIYEYRILLRRSKDALFSGGQWCLPFDEDRTPEKFDIELLERVAQDFVGSHDFAAFAARGHTAKTTVRKIFEVSVLKNVGAWEQRGLQLSILFKGEGFLRHQIRNMVGVLVEIATHKKSPQYVRELLSLGAGPTTNIQGLYCAPACGLYLKDIEYEE